MIMEAEVVHKEPFNGWDLRPQMRIDLVTPLPNGQQVNSHLYLFSDHPFAQLAIGAKFEVTVPVDVTVEV